MRRLLLVMLLIVCVSATAAPRTVTHVKAKNWKKNQTAHRARVSEEKLRSDFSNQKRPPHAKKLKSAGLPMPPILVALQAALAASGGTVDAPTDPEDYTTLYVGESNGVHTLNTYLTPVRYWDTASASLQPIDAELVPTPTQNAPDAYVCEKAYLRTKIGELGAVDTELFGKHLELTPVSCGTVAVAEQTAPVTVTLGQEVNQLQIADVIPGQNWRYEVSGSSVKETLVLDSKPTLSLSEPYTVTWSVGLNDFGIPALEGDAVRIGEVVLEPVVCRDASGHTTTGIYRLADGLVMADVDSAWMDSATYPVAIDPTVSGYGGIAYVMGAYNVNDGVGMLTFMIDLPDIGLGSTYNSSSLVLKKSTSAGTIANKTYTLYTSSDVSWTSATTRTAMTDLAITNGASNSSTATMGTGDAATTYTFTPSGASGASHPNHDYVAQAYSASTNPSNWTFSIYQATTNRDSTTYLASATTVDFPEDQYDSSYVRLYWTGDATVGNRPVLTVTYTAGAVTAPDYLYNMYNNRNR